MAMEISTSLTNLQISRPIKDSRGAVPAEQAKTPIKVEGSAHLQAAKKSSSDEDGQQSDRKSLISLVEEMNDRPQVHRRSLRFSVHESTGRTIVKVYDAETDELIREIPPEEVLAVMERIKELAPQDAVGVVLQEKA